MSGRTIRLRFEPPSPFASVRKGWYGLPLASLKTPDMLQPAIGPLTYHGAFCRNLRPLPNGRSYVNVLVIVCRTSNADSARSPLSEPPRATWPVTWAVVRIRTSGLASDESSIHFAKV